MKEKNILCKMAISCCLSTTLNALRLHNLPTSLRQTNIASCIIVLKTFTRNSLFKKKQRYPLSSSGCFSIEKETCSMFFIFKCWSFLQRIFCRICNKLPFSIIICHLDCFWRNDYIAFPYPKKTTNSNNNPRNTVFT